MASGLSRRFVPRAARLAAGAASRTSAASLTGVAASTGPGWPVASAAASSTASVPRIPAPARRDVAVRKAMETPVYPRDADI